ncbi:hypothetical protein [Mesorhizobium sp. ZC-5]|uniref:hypothetical protein n=1 Tax=Mesorhizobium sp. ZC-5 TaxID=2986066 RepID=UPI0021E8D04A|nr:hypothetical protein [Mesorhizobium sp. ZC-5]MCV3242060.1 hypothetical protein [Mesorhizobium sp. ZC-5]
MAGLKKLVSGLFIFEVVLPVQITAKGFDSFAKLHVIMFAAVNSVASVLRSVAYQPQSPIYLADGKGANMRISDDDYYTLDHFISAVLTRVRDGHCSAGEGRSAIMHTLTAWDRENWQEFGPWMTMMMEQWKSDNANRT